MIRGVCSPSSSTSACLSAAGVCVVRVVGCCSLECRRRFVDVRRVPSGGDGGECSWRAGASQRHRQCATLQTQRTRRGGAGRAVSTNHAHHHGVLQVTHTSTRKHTPSHTPATATQGAIGQAETGGSSLCGWMAVVGRPSLSSACAICCWSRAAIARAQTSFFSHSQRYTQRQQHTRPKHGSRCVCDCLSSPRRCLCCCCLTLSVGVRHQLRYHGGQLQQQLERTKGERTREKTTQQAQSHSGGRSAGRLALD